MKALTKKSEWYELFSQNIFNRTRQYSVLEFVDRYEHGEINPNETWILRNTVEQGAPFVSGLARQTYARCFERQFGDGQPFNIRHYVVSEKAPDDAIVVQGEFDGLNGRITFLKEPMRYALQKQEIFVSRLQLIDVIGYENYLQLQKMLDNYDTSLDYYSRYVVEFSLYSRPVGIFHEPLILWEIRKY